MPSNDTVTALFAASANDPAPLMVPETGVSVAIPVLRLKNVANQGVWMPGPTERETAMAEVSDRTMNAP